MSGVGEGGIGIRAGGGGGISDDDVGVGDIRRGEGGYKGEPEDGKVGESQGEVRQLIARLEERIRQLEEEAKVTKRELERREGRTEEVEFVDQKQMRPNVLKDGTTFRVWREEFERWTGLKLKGMQDVLRWLGGRKEWSGELEVKLNEKLEEHGLGGKRQKIDAQMKVALEAYTQTASE